MSYVTDTLHLSKINEFVNTREEIWNKIYEDSDTINNLLNSISTNLNHELGISNIMFDINTMKITIVRNNTIPVSNIVINTQLFLIMKDVFNIESPIMDVITNWGNLIEIKL